MFALAHSKPGTTLTFWLNRFSWGGFIWSLVRTRANDATSQGWNQPALQFDSEEAAQAFINSELAGNPEVRVMPVGD